MRPTDLSALARLARTCCDAAEARLAALRREEADLRRQIAALEAARQARAAEARATDLTVRAGVDLRWEGWIERRANLLATELARLRACIEIAREELARAFGRHTAADAIAREAQAQKLARHLGAAERSVDRDEPTPSIP